ncbi:AfsR/SARP family transcriptional regulator [Actinophytocola sp.]|uniref:AfsR/SARP family transcriptional regulator n=1 Tax=Actinophytocola sp. TaxID=1872138 RepID=UPI002D7FE1AC|nr:BTAD domain-containing putative transcriptional regulator [Actinophytocola sp.]HET9138476.1 BTAD domain-containing putative transcriptional regulator [Actinophytocola sp.]
MEFRVLGSVEAAAGRTVVDLGPARQRCVLAALLVDAGEVVSADELVERVWGERVPVRARATLRTYLSRLRAAGVEIGRRAGGYVLPVDRDAVDLHLFRTLTARAAQAARSAQTGGEAVDLLERALGLWHGAAFAGLDTPWLNALRDTLHTERTAAELDHVDLLLRAGRAGSLVAELSGRAAANPFDERVAGQLMLALFRSGRQPEALAVYQQVRTRLAEELGTDPGPDLRALHHRLLGGDPVPARPAHRQQPAGPAMLPAGVHGFAGRTAQLARLDAVLASADREPSAVVISAVSGTGGVGKTALALHWAHRIAGRFPDGQLYVNLRGFDPSGSVLPPEQALRSFLEALGVAPQEIPAGADGQQALFRRLVAHKRILVVLDNARDAEQVRPLLPGTPGCLVVVTSRNRLTGLVVAEGAQPVLLDVLSPGEAEELLVRRIGADRTRAEPDATGEIIARCARLPLALAIVAARASLHPDLPLATLVRELDAAGARLDAFADEEPAVDLRAVLSWSYRVLGDGARRLFRLLGLHFGAEFGAAAAASLAGIPLDRGRALLAELTSGHLLVESTSGRYTFHDLLRAYAIELAEREDGAADRQAATYRMLDHYLHTAHAAARLLHPQRAPVPLDPPRPGVTALGFTGLEDAIAWCTTERPALLAAVEHAGAAGADGHAWKLAWALTEFFDRRGHLEEQAGVYGIALRSACRAGDVTGQAHLYRNLGRTYAQLARYDDARAHFGEALERYAALGDLSGQANIQHNLGWTAELDGRMRDSLHHDQLAYDLYAAAGDRVGQARALNAIGWSHSLLGDHERALAVCEEALVLTQELGDRPGESGTWDSIGYAAHHLGRYPRALAAFQRSLEVLRELGDRDNEADVLIHLGDTYQAMGAPDDARTAWQAALDILDELGNPDAARVRDKLAEPPAAR